MNDSSLRSLAKAYAKGTIEQTAYREARAKLLHGILSGETVLQENEYPPLPKPMEDESLEVTERRPVKKKNELTETGSADSEKLKLPVWGVPAAIVAVILAVILILVLNSKPDAQNKSTAANEANAVDSTASGLQSGPALDLITNYLEKNSWSDASLDAFLLQWQALPPDSLTGINDTVEFGQITNAIHRKLLEERALAKLTKAESAIAKQQKLIDFAGQLGISDPRISMPQEHDADSPDKTGLQNTEMENTTQEVESSLLLSPGDSTNCTAVLAGSTNPYCRDEIKGIGKGPTMVVVPSGSFIMGGSEVTEQPRHEVVINYPMAISVHEITHGEFLQFCHDTGQSCPVQPWTGKDYPVVNVSWQDAKAYTDWLSVKTNRIYRLPSESEWEYIARAGTATAYPFGDSINNALAVYSDKKKVTAPLPKTDRTVNRNKFRLYHIPGNVREWVIDNWRDNYQGAPTDGNAYLDKKNPERVVRGGSYADMAMALRSSARTKMATTTADRYTGFRVIQEL